MAETKNTKRLADTLAVPPSSAFLAKQKRAKQNATKTEARQPVTLNEQNSATVPTEERIKSVLLILAQSGFLQALDLIRLGITCKTLQKAIILEEQVNYGQNGRGNDSNSLWATLSRSCSPVERCGIASDVAHDMGYLWAFQQLAPGRLGIHCSNPLPPLPPPSLRVTDMGIMISLDYESPNGRSTKTFSLSGPEQLNGLLESGEIEIDFSGSPIFVCRAQNLGIGAFDCDLDPEDIGKRTCVGPDSDVFESLAIKVYARFVRYTDRKSCCIYEPSKEFPEWGLLPTVKPLDRRNKNPRHAEVDELDFSRGSSRKGHILLEAGASHGIGLLRATQQGTMIQARFPYMFSLNAVAEIRALPDKTIAITGLSFEATKTHDGDFMGFFEEEENNNGVTIHHILSNLYFPE